MKYLILLLLLVGCCKKGKCGADLFSCSDINKCDFITSYKTTMDCEIDALQFKEIAKAKNVVYKCEAQWKDKYND